jgi:1-phosphofructokinase
MIYTVTINPSLDYIISAGEISFDDINRTTAEEMRFGGKGLNVSAVLAELGVRSTALGFKAGLPAQSSNRS